MFNYDNKVFEFINRVVDTMFTTLLWVVFSLPVITLGASTTAFYEVVHKVLRKNKGYVWHTFWSTFIANFKRSTIVWLIQLALSLFFYTDMKIMKDVLMQGEKGGWLYYFFLVTLIAMYAWFIFTTGNEWRDFSPKRKCACGSYEELPDGGCLIYKGTRTTFLYFKRI